MLIRATYPPGPIASMFWLDDELQSDIYLDGIVTVIDAKFGLEVVITTLRKSICLANTYFSN